MAETPATPANPFVGGGTEQNIDRQKALLNDLLAQEGQYGKDIFSRQAPDAQALLAQRAQDAGQQPDARKAVYDAFVRDAGAAEQQHTRTIERQAALNSQFLDQAKAAVPIHAQNMDQITNALKMGFEDRQSDRQAQLAAQRAQASASAKANAPKTLEQLIAEGVLKGKATQGIKAELLKDIPQSQWTASDAEAAGKKGKQLDYDEAASKLGMATRQKTAAGPGAVPGWLRDKDGITEIQTAIDGMYDQDYSFEQMLKELSSFAPDYPNWTDLSQVLLTANAPRWGIEDPALYGAKFAGGAAPANPLFKAAPSRVVA